MSVLVGLMGGFFGTQNKIFAEERAAKQAAAAKAIEARNAEIARIKGNLNNKEFKENIQNAAFSGELFSQLGGYGKEGENLINLIKPLISDVNEEDGLMVWGEDDNEISIQAGDIKDLKPGSFEEAEFYLNQFSNQLFETDFRTKVVSLLRSNTDQATKLKSNLGKWATTWKNQGMKRDAPTGADSLKSVNVPHIGNNFKGFEHNDVASMMQEIFTPYHISVAKDGLNVANNEFLVGSGTETDDGTKYWKISFDPNQLSILNTAATEVGVTAEEFVQNFGAVDYALLNSATTAAHVELAFKPLMVALDATFANLHPERVDPQGSEFMGGILDTDKYRIAEFLMTNLNTHKERAGAMAVHMKVGQKKKTGNINNETIDRQSVNTYIKNDVNGLELKDLSKGYEDSTTALTNLRELHRLMDEQDMPTGAAASVIEFMYGTVGPSGFIAQLIDGQKWNTNFENTRQEKEHNLAMERYQKEIDHAYSKSGSLGRIKALQIGLAFTLARAADPSGRLSNQDIDIQMARLGSGTGFKDKESSLARIEQVIRETENLQQFYKLFHELPRGSQYISKAKMVEIDGAVAAYNLEKFYRTHEIKNGVVQPRSALLMTSEQPGESVSDYIVVGAGGADGEQTAVTAGGMQENTMLEIPSALWDNSNIRQGEFSVTISGNNEIIAVTRDENDNIKEYIIGGPEDLENGNIEHTSNGTFKFNSNLLLNQLGQQVGQ